MWTIPSYNNPAPGNNNKGKNGRHFALICHVLSPGIRTPLADALRARLQHEIDVVSSCGNCETMASAHPQRCGTVLLQSWQERRKGTEDTVKSQPPVPSQIHSRDKAFLGERKAWETKFNDILRWLRKGTSLYLSPVRGELKSLWPRLPHHGIHTKEMPYQRSHFLVKIYTTLYGRKFILRGIPMDMMNTEKS